MSVSVISRRTLHRYKKLKRFYATRRAAFRAAKRDGGVPTSSNPDEVIVPNTDLGDAFGLDDRNVRLYIFSILIGAIVVEYHIREDKEAFYGGAEGIGDQDPHFNSGDKDSKLDNHHYWKND